MDEKLEGYTREGFPVVQDSMVSLQFVFICVGKVESNGISIAIAFNKTPCGERRPYLAIQLFNLLIQSGWLF